MNDATRESMTVEKRKVFLCVRINAAMIPRVEPKRIEFIETKIVHQIPLPINDKCALMTPKDSGLCPLIKRKVIPTKNNDVKIIVKKLK
jgi:hypothetical protein